MIYCGNGQDNNINNYQFNRSAAIIRAVTGNLEAVVEVRLAPDGTIRLADAAGNLADELAETVSLIPAALPQVSVIAQKVGETSISSEQLRGKQDMQADGNSYIVGSGPPLAAGAASCASPCSTDSEIELGSGFVFSTQERIGRIIRKCAK